MVFNLQTILKTQGVLSGVSVNTLSPLNMATDRDPRVRMIGDVHQITSIGSIPSYAFDNEVRYIQKV